jgi:hypothetical protein
MASRSNRSRSGRRGTITNNAWLHTRAAALNLRRLINLGLTHPGGTWTISPTTVWTEEPPGPLPDSPSEGSS